MYNKLMKDKYCICAITGGPVAFKIWFGHQHRVGIICPPLVEIGLGWLPKLGVDTSPRPHAHRRVCIMNDVQGLDRF